MLSDFPVGFLGWLTLVLSLGWGYQLARKIFSERDRFCLLVASPALALVTLLLTGAFLRRQLMPEQLALPTFGLLALGTLLLSRLPAEPLSNSRPTWGTWLFFALSWPTVLFYALFELSTGMVVDGDFFVHVASIGLFEEGHYPPQNYFLGIPTGGHFGRQLLIAQFARFSGLQFLTADWVLTAFLMLQSFTLLFCLLREQTESQLQAMLGTAMAFFAANTGSRIGLVDTLGNHNPVAFFFLITVAWAVPRALRIGGAALPVAAVILGLEAMVYEIHFGLVGLTLPLMILVAPSGRRASMAARVVVVGLTALLIAAVAGGAFSDLASRGSGPSQARQQQVSVKFPKSELFMLRADNMRPSRPFEGKMRAWKAEFAPSQDYTFALGARIRDLFWYPTWLFPLAFCACLIRRHQAGVWFGGLAGFAWLIPSVVDFGFYEGEGLRWLFVTAVCGSVTFGVGVGMLFEAAKLRWWWKAPILALVLWFSSAGLIRSAHDMVWALQNPGQQLPIGRPGIVAEVGLVPAPFPLLTHHYGLRRDDFRAAQWLRTNTPRDARILGDDDQESVNYRCAVFGLSGRLPAAYLPQVTDSTEPSGYRRRLQVDEFWRNGDSRLLAGLKVDWLLVHPAKHAPNFLKTLRESKDLKLRVRYRGVEIYKCQIPEPTAPVADLTVKSAILNGTALTLTAEHSSETPLEWITVGFLSPNGALVGGPQWRQVPTWPKGSPRTITVNLVAPHEEGAYSLAIWGGRAKGDEPGKRL